MDTNLDRFAPSYSQLFPGCLTPLVLDVRA